METALSIIAIILSVISGGFVLYSFAWTAQRDRKQATLDAYNLLQEQALDHLNYYMPAQIVEIANTVLGETMKINDDEYNNPDVPPWAIKLVLQKDEI